MNNKLEQFANSGFMKKLQEWSVKALHLEQSAKVWVEQWD